MKHNFIFSEKKFCVICIRCDGIFSDIYKTCGNIMEFKNFTGLAIDYVNTVMPCLSNEELVIKKLLE